MRTHENVTNNLSYRGHVCCAKRFFTLGTICGTNTKSLFAMSTMFATHASTQICSEAKNFLLFFKVHYIQFYQKWQKSQSFTPVQ